MLRSDKYEMTRRDLLRLSAAGVLGTSISGWFGVLASRAAEAVQEGKKHKSCILLYMNGGPAQSHTFDLKGGSEYKAIKTTVPGIEISEHLPKIAEQMQNLTILRSMSTGDGNHQTARYLMHTGYRAGAGGTTYPSLGSIVSAELGHSDAVLPNFVSVGGNGMSPGYLGPKHAALNVTDPLRGVENLKPLTEQDELDERATLLNELDKNFLGEYQATSIEAHQKGYQKALELMNSVKSKTFDLSQEPESVRSAYGRGNFGQGCLLARRLVEVGVPFVEVSLGGWDTHQGAAQPVQRLSQQLDPGMGTLVKELKERGLLDSTLVIWMGEFGRSPGRGQNHYARAWSTVLGGAGIKTGMVVGKTDTSGGTVAERPINVVDFMATICQILGIDPNKQILAKGNRPHRIVDKGANPVKELFA
jgi:uncharacterized protein (DUF1501 family)